MGTLLADDLLAGAGVDLDGDLVPHAAAGNEDGGLAREYLGGAMLEPIDGRVFAIHVIADLGFRHGATHLRRWASDGVTAQVDRGDRFLVFGVGRGAGNRRGG